MKCNISLILEVRKLKERSLPALTLCLPWVIELLCSGLKISIDWAWYNFCFLSTYALRDCLTLTNAVTSLWLFPFLSVVSSWIICAYAVPSTKGILVWELRYRLERTLHKSQSDGIN